MQRHLEIYPTPEALAEAAAAFLVRLAQQAVRENGRFTIALSGGRTPEQLFALLAAPPYREEMPWDQTLVFWGDERCVPADDPRNNARMARTLLLDRVPIPAANIFPVPVELPPRAAAEQYEQTIRRVFDPNPPRFDLILLGMGPDGHTASLFPGTPVLEEKTRWVEGLYVPAQQMDRVTMTFPLINMARCVLFLVAGKEKAEILKSVLEPDAPSGPALPAGRIQPSGGELLWWVDEAATAALH